MYIPSFVSNSSIFLPRVPLKLLTSFKILIVTYILYIIVYMCMCLGLTMQDSLSPCIYRTESLYLSLAATSYNLIKYKDLNKIKQKAVGNFFVVCFSRNRISMCNSPGYPGTHSVDQASLELTEICLSLPPECWD